MIKDVQGFYLNQSDTCSVFAKSIIFKIFTKFVIKEIKNIKFNMVITDCGFFIGWLLISVTKMTNVNTVVHIFLRYEVLGEVPNSLRYYQ